MIEVKNLVKKYGNHVAVDGLTFSIDKGRVYGFLGPNGAGKTTTMNIITGYLAATKGSVTVNGYDILKKPEEFKKSVGYLPELPPVYMDMTVREYLLFTAELKGVPKKERQIQTGGPGYAGKPGAPLQRQRYAVPGGKGNLGSDQTDSGRRPRYRGFRVQQKSRGSLRSKAYAKRRSRYSGIAVFCLRRAQVPAAFAV